MEKAIKKAIEGGWVDKYFSSELNVSNIPQIVCLDPLFWQCLGKAEGWKKGQEINGIEQVKGSGWWCKWHDFIDHLANSEDIESFFINLLK